MGQQRESGWLRAEHLVLGALREGSPTWRGVLKTPRVYPPNDPCLGKDSFPAKPGEKLSQAHSKPDANLGLPVKVVGLWVATERNKEKGEHTARAHAAPVRSRHH